MIVAQCSKTTTASPEKIWSLYADVATWPTWDDDINHAAMVQDKFLQGERGFITTPEGTKLDFVLSEVVEYASFTTVTTFHLARLIFHQLIERQPDNTITITHTAKITGLAALIVYGLIGRRIKNNLPQGLDKLVTLAETDA